MRTTRVKPSWTYCRRGACPRTAKGAVFCMVLFLRLEETLTALEKSAKSANATFILGGVDVEDGEIQPC